MSKTTYEEDDDVEYPPGNLMTPPRTPERDNRRQAILNIRQQWRLDHNSRSPKKKRRSNEEQARAFFRASPEPKELDTIRDRVRKFVEAQGTSRIVVVTSGSTPVPLEKKTVRYIDNFSTGTRGARCVENFLRNGYAVIFLHRSGSAFPFLTNISSQLRQKPSELYNETVSSPSKALQDRLETVQFDSLFSYLFLLREICQIVSKVDKRCMIVLAAAVADFYVPTSSMAKEKIQSRSHDGLELKLKNTPKMLGLIRSTWGASNAMIVSFKLETNENILLAKAAGAIQKYNVDAVVANVLETRYDEVHVIRKLDDESVVEIKGTISGEETEAISVSGVAKDTVRKDSFDVIELPLVRKLCDLHAEKMGLSLEEIQNMNKNNKKKLFSDWSPADTDRAVFRTAAIASTIGAIAMIFLWGSSRRARR